ncbi:MAG TPA: hypothetical protein VFA21_15735 [Pyrinomonadaceae bacterium]|nr:hypothetical protein [Pyrinomonadaceae bacterium]
MSEHGNDEQPLCPSARPEMKGAVAFGAVAGTVEEPFLVHFAAPQPVSDELLALARPAEPTEVFRFAAPCAGHACAHFDGQDCRLAARVVQILPAVTSSLPPCVLRPECRWWQQEGKAACLRCPQVVSECVAPSEEMMRAALPEGDSASFDASL